MGAQCGTLDSFGGCEIASSRGLSPVNVGTARASRDTVNFSPNGGIASLSMNFNVANTVTTAYNFPSTLLGSAAESIDGTQGFTCEFMFTAATTTEDMPIVSIIVADSGSTTITQVGLWCQTTQANKTCNWYRTAAGVQNGKGTLIGNAGAIALVANTWYRIAVVWTYSQTGLNTVTCRINGVADANATWTPAGAPNNFSLPRMGANTATAVDGSGKFDNFAYYRNTVAAGSPEPGGTPIDTGFDPIIAVVGLVPTGNGTDNADFSLGGTTPQPTAWQSLNTLQSNADTDYITVTSTAAKKETVATPAPTAPTNYPVPIAFGVEQTHENQNAGKWSSPRGPRVYFNGVGRSFTGAQQLYTDPAAAYQNYGSVMLEGPTAGVALTPADLTKVEIGIFQLADANDTAIWRSTAIAAEVCYLKPVVEPQLLNRRRFRVMEPDNFVVGRRYHNIGNLSQPVVASTRRKFAWAS